MHKDFRYAVQLPGAENTPALFYVKEQKVGSDGVLTPVVRICKERDMPQQTVAHYPYSVATMGITNDPVTGRVVSATLAYQNRVEVFVLKSFLPEEKISDERLSALMDQCITGPFQTLEVSISSHDTVVELLSELFTVTRRWSPDYLGVWHIDYIVPLVLDAIIKAGLDPRDIIGDPLLSRGLSLCRYDRDRGVRPRGPKGSVHVPVHLSDRAHDFVSTTPFKMVDMMLVYRSLRRGKPRLPTYALGAVLKSELDKDYPVLPEIEHLSGKARYAALIKDYPLHSVVCGIWEVLGLLELDLLTQDLAVHFPRVVLLKTSH